MSLWTGRWYALAPLHGQRAISHCVTGVDPDVEQGHACETDDGSQRKCPQETLGLARHHEIVARDRLAAIRSPGFGSAKRYAANKPSAEESARRRGVAIRRCAGHH